MQPTNIPALTVFAHMDTNVMGIFGPVNCNGVDSPFCATSAVPNASSLKRDPSNMCFCSMVKNAHVLRLNNRKERNKKSNRMLCCTPCIRWYSECGETAQHVSKIKRGISPSKTKQTAKCENKCNQTAMSLQKRDMRKKEYEKKRENNAMKTKPPKP